MPLTCGEWVQGLVGGRLLVASCGVTRYATARVRLRPAGGTAVLGLADRPKAARALAGFLGARGVCARVTVDLDNPAPRGRGYGTSTADVLAVLAAAARALGEEPDPAELTRWARGIEPSDGTAFPGVAVLDGASGEALWRLPPPPPLPLLVLDPGGEVDTERFHRRPDLARRYREAAPATAEALAALVAALEAGDPLELGRAATLSARAYQAVLEHPLLPLAWRLGRRFGTLGLVRAHTGTVLGLLFPPDAERRRILAALRDALPGIALYWTSVRGGGLQGREGPACGPGR